MIAMAFYVIKFLLYLIINRRRKQEFYSDFVGVILSPRDSGIEVLQLQ